MKYIKNIDEAVSSSSKLPKRFQKIWADVLSIIPDLKGTWNEDNNNPDTYLFSEEYSSLQMVCSDENDHGYDVGFAIYSNDGSTDYIIGSEDYQKIASAINKGRSDELTKFIKTDGRDLTDGLRDIVNQFGLTTAEKFVKEWFVKQ